MSTDYEELNSPEFVAGLKAGLPDAQWSFVKRVTPLLVPFVMRYSLSYEDSEEVVSTVCHKAMLNLDQFDSSKANFMTWLFRIAQNTAIDFRKKKERELPTVPLPKDMAGDSTGRREEDAMKSSAQAVRLAKLDQAMQELRSADRDLLTWRANGVPFKDIALWLGKTKASVKVAHFRALHRLRTYFQRMMAEEAEA